MSSHETINSERHVRPNPSFLFGQLTDGKSYGYLLQNNESSPTAKNSIVALDEVFDERVIG